MRKFLIAIVGIALAIGAFYAVAVRFSDGPFGIVAGGPLQRGELIHGEPDWVFAHDVPTIELQLLSPPRSRTVWMIEHEGKSTFPVDIEIPGSAGCGNNGHLRSKKILEPSSESKASATNAPSFL